MIPAKGAVDLLCRIGRGTRVLQHAQYDRADKGHGRIGGDDAQLTDESCHGGASLSCVSAQGNVESRPAFRPADIEKHIGIIAP